MPSRIWSDSSSCRTGPRGDNLGRIARADLKKGRKMPSLSGTKGTWVATRRLEPVALFGAGKDQPTKKPAGVCLLGGTPGRDS